MVDSIQNSQLSAFVADTAIQKRFEQIADRKATEAQNVSVPERVDATRADRAREEERFGATTQQRNDAAAAARTQAEGAFRDRLDERAPESDRLIAVRVGGVAVPDPIEASEEAVTQAALNERAVIRRVSAVLAEREEDRARVASDRELSARERVAEQIEQDSAREGVTVTEETRPERAAAFGAGAEARTTVRERVLRDAQGERVAAGSDPDPRLVTEPRVNPSRDDSTAEPFSGELDASELSQVTSVLPGTGAILDTNEVARVPDALEAASERRSERRDRAEERATQIATVEADRTGDAITRFLEGTPAPDPGPEPRPTEVLAERA